MLWWISLWGPSTFHLWHLLECGKHSQKESLVKCSRGITVHIYIYIDIHHEWMDVKRKWKKVAVSRFSLPYIPFWCWLVLLLDGFIGDVRLVEFLILIWFHLQCSTTLDQGNVDLRVCRKNQQYFQKISVISRHPWFWTLLRWSFCLLVSSWWIKTWWHTQHVWPAAFVAKGYVVVFPITFCVILIMSLGKYRNNATGTCRSHIDLKETCLTFAEKPFEQKMEEYFVDLNHLSHKSVWLWSVSRRQDQTSTVTVTSFAMKCAASAGVKGPRRQRQNRHPPQVWQKGMSFGIWGCLKLRELESWIVLNFLVISNNLRRAPFWSFL